MKKNIILSALFIFAAIVNVSLIGNVYAQDEGSFESDKAKTAYVLQVSPNVVINEIYGGSELAGNAYNADFIELYNNSAVAVNISDYSVQYYTSGQINEGAPTSSALIPDATILQPFSVYVIRVSPLRGTGSALTCEDLNASASFAETGIDADGGKLVLSSTSANLAGCTSTSPLVVDRVGYGITPIICNETNNGIQPSASTSVQRRNSAPDTDNNLADFITFAAPTPCAQTFGPTAAAVNVGGRVTNAFGRGISRALVRMTDAAGVTRTTYTVSFGYYNFADVEVGQTTFFEVKAKGYTFAEPTRGISVNEELLTLDFIAQ